MRAARASRLCGPEHELKGTGRGSVQVLAGVEQVHDLGRFGELGAGDVPDLIPVPRLSRRSPARPEAGPVSVMRAGIIRGGPRKSMMLSGGPVAGRALRRQRTVRSRGALLEFEVGFEVYHGGSG